MQTMDLGVEDESDLPCSVLIDKGDDAAAAATLKPDNPEAEMVTNLFRLNSWPFLTLS